MAVPRRFWLLQVAPRRSCFGHSQPIVLCVRQLCSFVQAYIRAVRRGPRDGGRGTYVKLGWIVQSQIVAVVVDDWMHSKLGVFLEKVPVPKV